MTTKTILIIDDDPVVMNMVGARLRAKGYRILSASYGNEGVVLARTSSPDLIILDFRLPDILGSEVSKQLLVSEAVKGVPIILMTASKDTIVDKAQKCGAVEYLSKPVDVDDMYEKVARCLGE